jgi:hypothetical protein
VSSFVVGQDGRASMVGAVGGPDDEVLVNASHLGDHDAMTTPLLALLGVLLIILAIPFGLMLAPLAIGVILIWFGMRRLGGLLETPEAA